MSSLSTKKDKNANLLIIILSVVVPTLVAFLLFSPTKIKNIGDWVYFLPHLHAVVNGLTALILPLALYFVKKGNIVTHKRLMSVAFVLGALFLVSYVVYHASVPSTKFGDVNGDGTADIAEIARLGIMRVVYLVVLSSHIVLAAIVLPFVLFSYYYGLKSNVKMHKKVVRFAFPIWLYVSISGVVVYLMISPYYQF